MVFVFCSVQPGRFWCGLSCGIAVPQRDDIAGRLGGELPRGAEFSGVVSERDDVVVRQVGGFDAAREAVSLMASSALTPLSGRVRLAG